MWDRRRSLALNLLGDLEDGIDCKFNRISVERESGDIEFLLGTLKP